MSQSFQLTKYPIGSIREIWALSWPLMLGLISSSLMMFSDRLLLAWYSSDALNAGVNAGMANFIFAVVPIAICSISEVLAGRLNGEGKLTEIGKAVWQMCWFALFLTPLFWALAKWAPPLIFYGSHNLSNEMAYFQPLMCFSPFLATSIALSGFFIATGNVKIVTLCTILGNAFNILADTLFIFGAGPIPEMGIFGAALATGMSFLLQTLLYLSIFLRKKYQTKYGTNCLHFNEKYLREGLRIGVPASLGHAVEIVAHFIFFRIVLLSGHENMAIVGMVQSFFLLISFLNEAIMKSVSSICANLLGAKHFDQLHDVLKSAMKLVTIFFFIIIGCVIFFPQTLIHFFFSADAASIVNPTFIAVAAQALVFMSIFFLFDGYSWVMIGNLTASGDTKFIFYVSAIMNWSAYVIPAFFILGLGKYGANVAWMLIATYSFLTFLVYLWRYRSRKWLETYLSTMQT